MGFWSNVISRFGRSQLFDIVIQNNSNSAIYPDAKASYYLETYTGNSDVFSVISKIVDPSSRIPVTQVNKKTLKEQPGRAIELLNNPNPFQSKTEFIEQALTVYEIFGECLIASEKPEFGLNAKKPVRLDNLPPQWVELKIGNFFSPIEGYRLMLGQQEVNYPYSDVMHWRKLNPNFQLSGEHLRGMSPLKPLLKAVAASSSGYDSMVSMFQNMGAYGMLTILGVKDEEGKYSGQPKTKEQLSELERSFRQKLTGNSNRGKIFATNKSVEYTNFGLNSVDMNILNSIVFSGGALYDAYGVPDILKSGSQSKTYMNYGEAQKALWNNTNIPTVEGFYSKLSNWLMPLLGEEDTMFLPDFDDVPALQTDKGEMVKWMIQAGFSLNMIWEALGYESLNLPNMNVPLVGLGLQRIDELGIIDPGLTEQAMKEFSDYRRKGGEGSGNFNHEGRPGEVGGSGEGGAAHDDGKRYYNYRANEAELDESIIFCSDNPEDSSHYGNIQRVFKTTENTDKDYKEITNIAEKYYKCTTEEAFDAINPLKIVSSGGAWDDIDFINHVYDNTNYFVNHDGIVTHDGAVFFEVNENNLVSTNYLKRKTLKK